MAAFCAPFYRQMPISRLLPAWLRQEIHAGIVAPPTVADGVCRNRIESAAPMGPLEVIDPVLALALGGVCILFFVIGQLNARRTRPVAASQRTGWNL